MKEKMFYHRSNGDVYESDYVDMFEHDEIPVNIYFSDMRRKLAAVQNIEHALQVSGIDEFGSLAFVGLSYHVYGIIDDWPENYIEFVQIIHDDNSSTMIDVTGDTVNALLRDIMRAGLM